MALLLAVWLAVFGIWPFASPDCGAFTPGDPMVLADWMLHLCGAVYAFDQYRRDSLGLPR